MIGYINAIGIYIKFGSRSAILHIVLPIVLRQPRAFHVTAQYGVGMVLSETFPAMFGHVEVEECYRFAFLDETVVLVELYPPDGIDVGGAPKHIGFTIIVNKECRVLQIG